MYKKYQTGELPALVKAGCREAAGRLVQEINLLTNTLPGAHRLMTHPSSVLRRGVFASSVVLAFFSILFAASQLPGQTGAVVTETMRIEIDKRVHTARKINGRWWSEDNRELSKTNVGWLWQVSGGNARHLVRFDHHRPLDPTKVNLLDRSMGPDQVKAILGPPNSVFPNDRPAAEQHWDYYGAGGYKLSIHFSSSGGIFTASYEPDAKSMPKDVPHLVFRVNGKSARESYEENKNQPRRQVPASQEELRKQLQEEMARRRSQTSQTPSR